MNTKWTFFFTEHLLNGNKGKKKRTWKCWLSIWKISIPVNNRIQKGHFSKNIFFCSSKHMNLKAHACSISSSQLKRSPLIPETRVGSFTPFSLHLFFTHTYNIGLHEISGLLRCLSSILMYISLINWIDIISAPRKL